MTPAQMPVADRHRHKWMEHDPKGKTHADNGSYPRGGLH
jgi:hypothetical protein